jgi:tryptophanyl-tRNA synthetase
MSKSIADPRGTILLSDAPDVAAKKIKSATTDSVGVINFDWDKQPGITNLLQILALLGEKPQDVVNADWVGKTNYGELKTAIADLVRQSLATFQARAAAVDEDHLLARLAENETQMNLVANATLLRVQRAVGLRDK